MTPREPADPDAGPALLLQDVLAHERAYHDTCRAALAAMVEGAGEQVVVGEDVSASGADAEVLGYRLRSRAKEMRELPEGPLFFGRLDFAAQADSDHAAAQADSDHAGQSYHLGRLRISEDPAVPPLVVDWRAPVSRAFYQASARDPQGVAVRRRFGWAPGSRGDSADLTGMEDEHLAGSSSSSSPGAGAGAGAATGVDTSSPGSLLAAEIERPRLGPMRDIAATIQPEQDDLVRADLATSVCVQGAPGTGKTAVGLHRAAYLLYTHPQRIRRGGLLILGPNRTFLSYIAEVLPALGETGVRQSTVTDEIARHEVRAEDDERAAVVKHDARMAEVLRRALYAGVAGGESARAEAFGTLVLAEGSYRWRVAGDELRRIVAGVRAEELPYDVGRERVRARVVRLLQEQAEWRAGPRPNAWLYRISRSRPVGAYVDAVWPKVRPEEVVARLLGDPDVLAGAAEGLLDADEQKAVAWAKPPRTWRSARWSAVDLVLLDEVAGLLAHPDGYGHVVVDEAQDLSPMECRAIARRAAYGSVTVLGDLAQGTTPWAARDWPGLLAHLGKPDAHVVPLTTGFRVPQAVVGLANGLLDRLGVDVPAARSLRRDGELRIRRVEGAEVVAEAVAAVRDALACEGSVGVIAADGPDVVRLCQALDEAGIPVGGPDELRARVTVLGAGVAKGLEYDHVVVVEPAAIAAAEERGLHRLYVVLTRAVSRLDVVHARALPW
ncbi:AAA family ATPase [Streptomyces caniscabiei]|uniref:HelD family protein n=1 Tax=Streptomyces caniscabiei TaxID=2746961 RepID=UPI0029A25F3C|nr:AAA family ATPase [Streptomyces caniscabiei]MDX2603084.1 AAA family ATPase [Streptomyces caniscabiei]MDX2737629.1 AAA family ATPase [Streptomyces caniscabiei]MDX2780795.1 AAA family ATPase [Streptomyces caniscabiei]